VAPTTTPSPRSDLSASSSSRVFVWPASSKFIENGPAADKSLPLYPRLHLLPNGHVYYGAAGQAFNPVGQSYDEALWNVASVYDPASRSWSDIGVPGVNLSTGDLGGAEAASFTGFRGSTFQQMLPLKAPYRTPAFLTAGGVVGTTPGSYVPVAGARIDRVDLNGSRERIFSYSAGSLAERRWYPTGVSLPTGQVLVGGHDPIPNSYTYPMNNPSMPGGREFANNFKDASFEIFSPPYLFWGPRPTLGALPGTLSRGRIARVPVTTGQAGPVESVVLVRNTAQTHLVDGDQRTVELPIVGRGKGFVEVSVPASASVLPPGGYLLFANQRAAKGLIPSVSHQISLGVPGRAEVVRAAATAASAASGPSVLGAVSALGATIGLQGLPPADLPRRRR